MAFNHLSCEQLKQWLLQEGNEINLVDIRDNQSFQLGHIEGAQLIDNQNVENFIVETDKNKPLVVCCYHGNSSQGAANYFNEQGFQNCYSLDGGYEGWKTIA